MGRYTTGTGDAVFNIDYLDATVPTSGSNEYGTADAKNYPICAFAVDAFNSYNTAANGTEYSDANTDNMPITYSFVGGSELHFGYQSNSGANGYFTNTALLYNNHVVTNVTDIQRLVWNVPITETSQSKTFFGDNSATSFKTYAINSFYNQSAVDIYDNENLENVLTSVLLLPVTISPINKNALQGYLPCDYRNGDQLDIWGGITTRWNGTHVSGNTNSARYRPTFPPVVDFPRGNNLHTALKDLTGKYALFMDYSTNNFAQATVRYYCISEDEILFIAACNGLKFRYKNKIYKPIVSGGIVTGYTDNMAFKSEFDDWHTLNDHTVPSTPPVTARGDREKNMELSDHVSISGFIKYYIIDRSKADAISDCISRVDILSIGKDYTNNLISYKLFPISGYTQGAARTITIGGKEMEYANGDKITGVPVTGILPKTISGIKISETFHDFRDYAPFTRIEIFVPFCGWAQLPPWCMNKTISGTMFFDLANGTVKAVIKASQTVVAEMGGVCAIDVPFTSTANGVKAGHILANMASGMSSAFNPTPQNVLSANVGMLTAFNANFTQTKGVMGDGSNIDGLTQVWIKVTRPAVGDIASIPAQYKHDLGIPCGKQLTLSVGDGYTQVLDANITGAMTDREKQMIIDGFRHGLIL